MKSFKRSQRVADQIRRDVSEIIADLLRDKTHLMVTVSEIDLTKDLRNAKILYTVLGGEAEREEAADFFKARIKKIQKELAQRLRIRRMPELTAQYDESLLEGLRVSALIDKVIGETETREEYIDNDRVKAEIVETLMSSKRVLLVGHMNPDGDSLGSQLGLAQALDNAGIDYEIVNEGIIPTNYTFLPGIESVSEIGSYDQNGTEFDTAVFMECSNRERIGNVDRLIQDGCKIINIDHHHDNSEFGDLNYLDFRAAAAGEMIYYLLKDEGIEITQDIAVNLYTAILTDTGRFQFNSTTPNCFRVAADLVEKGADTSWITEKVYFNQTIESLKLTGDVLTELEYFLDNRVCFMTIEDSTLNRTNATKADTEGLVNYTLRAEGVLVGALFSQKAEGITKASLRSRKEISIIDVAAKFGGGGHKNACGCTVEMSLDDTKSAILKSVEELLDG